MRVVIIFFTLLFQLKAGEILEPLDLSGKTGIFAKYYYAYHSQIIRNTDILAYSILIRPFHSSLAFFLYKKKEKDKEFSLLILENEDKNLTNFSRLELKLELKLGKKIIHFFSQELLKSKECTVNNIIDSYSYFVGAKFTEKGLLSGLALAPEGKKLGYLEDIVQLIVFLNNKSKLERKTSLDEVNQLLDKALKK